MLKRLFDLIISLSLFILLFIPFLGIVVLIAMIDGLPVIFSQQRPGQDGKPFRLYKFRTMNQASSATGELLPDEERLTRFGMILRKLSLDELPQLINVIKGDMSLVGPRPLLMEYLPLYTEEQARRHVVRPGITGWAQVNGRNAISWEQKFEYDVWYVDNQSFRQDLIIVWMTFLKLITREGVSHQEHVTMPRFTGARQKEE